VEAKQLQHRVRSTQSESVGSMFGGAAAPLYLAIDNRSVGSASKIIGNKNRVFDGSSSTFSRSEVLPVELAYESSWVSFAEFDQIM